MWRHLVAKFGTNANGTIWWPNLEPMQVAFFLAEEIARVKESIPWVRCAAGNVFIGNLLLVIPASSYLHIIFNGIFWGVLVRANLYYRQMYEQGI